jgi:hypothetical protein
MNDILTLSTPVATRTLIASGYRIIDVQRQPNHIELYCERRDIFGVIVNYVFCIVDLPQPLDDEIRFVKKRAATEGLSFVLIAQDVGPDWLSWREFLELLGGAVPQWRALTADYGTLTLCLGRNELPAGVTGEPWKLFEDAIADGFEFVLGHRVRRLGARMRGEPVADVLLRTPDDKIIVVDAKASKAAFSVGADELRPIREYVKRQRQRQQGDLPVNGALIVANTFEQDELRLVEISNDLLSEMGVPLAFLETSTLVQMVTDFSFGPYLRNKLRWAKVLCRVGCIRVEEFKQEYASTRNEHVSR